MVCFVLTPRCFAYRQITTLYQPQKGLGAGGNMRGSKIFCQFYLVLSLYYSLQRGSNGFIAEKTILILYQGSRGGPLFSRGVSNFFQGGGPNANFYRKPYTYMLFSRSGVSGPLSPSGPAHGQSQQNETIFITVSLLTIIVRHWFVRINDRWGFPCFTGTSHVWHLRKTQLLEVVVFAIQLFFSKASTTSTQWVEQYRWLAYTK